MHQLRQALSSVGARLIHDALGDEACIAIMAAAKTTAGGAAASPANPVRGSAMAAITKLNTRAANPRRVAAIIKLAL